MEQSQEVKKCPRDIIENFEILRNAVDDFMKVSRESGLISSNDFDDDMSEPGDTLESDFNIDSPMGFELTEDEVNYIKQVEDEEKKQRADDAQRGREIIETFLSTSRAARCASRRLLNYKPGEWTTTNRLRATIPGSFATDYLAAVSTISYIKNPIEFGGLRSVHVGISCIAMEFDDEVTVFADYDLCDAIHTVAVTCPAL